MVLVAVFLHKAPLPAYQRGFFCGDPTISQPYKSSTVPTLVLTGVGFAVPVVSVSPGEVQQGEDGSDMLEGPSQNVLHATN